MSRAQPKNAREVAIQSPNQVTRAISPPYTDEEQRESKQSTDLNLSYSEREPCLQANSQKYVLTDDRDKTVNHGANNLFRVQLLLRKTVNGRRDKKEEEAGQEERRGEAAACQRERKQNVTAVREKYLNFCANHFLPTNSPPGESPTLAETEKDPFFLGITGQVLSSIQIN
ncbi:hypothetical protein STEG23_021572 [Scotinomys teguina]